ncbi:MAG: MFS transporter [SAR202 cluster bacterium]|nr:MFS transporter [SAR202 cluster bacterium]
MGDGLRRCTADRDLRAVTWIALFTETFGFSFIFFLPDLVNNVLGHDERVLGVVTALFSVGGIAGTLVLTGLGEVRWRGWGLMLASAAFGALFLAAGLSGNIWLTGALMLAAGSASVVYDVFVSVLFQTLAPDEARGRVVAVHGMMISGINVGACIVGGLAELRGTRFALALATAGVTLNALRLLPVGGALSRRSSAAKTVAVIGGDG